MGCWGRAGWVGAAAMWALVGMGGGPAEAAKWGRAEINALPDEAFASVEQRPDGTRARHLPHHDAAGGVDLPHLRNALSRWNQVQWADPASAERAREHLLRHFRELGLPVPGAAGGPQRLAPRRRILRSDPTPSSPFRRPRGPTTGPARAADRRRHRPPRHPPEAVPGPRGEMGAPPPPEVFPRLTAFPPMVRN